MLHETRRHLSRETENVWKIKLIRLKQIKNITALAKAKVKITHATPCLCRHRREVVV
jgi:hypothetical protein